MAYLLPISSDPLDNPDHSLLHRIVAVDEAAAEQSLKIDPSSNAILLGGVQVETSFTGKEIATPSNPAAGYNSAYFKSDDRLYLLNSAGTELLVGNISGSTGATDNAILRANGTGGTTLQTTGITIDDNDNLVFTTATANDTKGIIYRGSNRWLHGYYPTNAGGNNIFLGTNAGNFTMTADVGESWEASNLIGIGAGVLAGITQGYLFVAIGSNAYAAATSGSAGTALGHFAFQRNTGAAGTALGYNAGRYVVGYADTLVGISAGQGTDTVSTYGYTTAVGAFAGIALTTPNFNTFIGTYAGSNVTTGANNLIISSTSTQGTAATLVSGNYNIVMGSTNSLALSSTSTSYEMNIANALYAVGLYGTVRFGIGVSNANITARLHLPAGSTSAGYAPLKFTSGSLMSSAEAGAMEFLTDAYYLTITTGAARQQIVTDTNTVTISNKTLTAPRFANGGFIADANGNELLIFTTTASAVNEITIANAATANTPYFLSSGGDTNISFAISSKGTGGIHFSTGSFSRNVLSLVNTASSVNYFQMAPAVTTANPTLSAVGSDSNIGLDFQAKGTGVYRFLATASGPTDLRLFEDTDNGSNYVSLIAPASMASDRVLTLPDATDTLVGKATTDTFTNKTLTNTNNNVAAKSLHSATTVVDVSAATAPSSGQILTATSSTTATWQTPTATGFTSRIRVYRNAVQSINDNTFTKVQFNTESYDGLNEYDNATNYRFTATATGYYMVHSAVTFDTVGTSNLVKLAVYVNGTIFGDAVYEYGAAANNTIQITEILSLSATDYVEIFAYQNQGGARNAIANATLLTIHRLS